MQSDLTAAIEAAKRLARIHTGENPVDVYGADPNLSDPSNQYVIDMRLSLGRYLDWCSQPLYRRRKDFAKWEQSFDHAGTCWKHYQVYPCQEKWRADKRWSNFSVGVEYETQELAQAACEEHFWSELEGSVLERVS